jgi:2-aminoadipate transaminase
MNLEANDFNPVKSFTAAQLAYTVPNFSNPSGRLVGLETRKQLVEAAETTGTWLVEDDPCGTLYYDSAPLPRMLTLNGEGKTGSYQGPIIYLGTLSKEVAPGLRLGWVIAAPELIVALTAAKQGSDMCTSGLCQRIALDAFATGLSDRMLPGILSLYRNRRDALCEAMDAHLSEWFDWQKPSGGMFVWATAKDPEVNTDLLLQRALERGVCITPSSVFDPEGTYRRSIRVNFTFNDPDRLAEGVKRLALAMRELKAASSSR